MDNTIKYFAGANWVTLSGSFTPKELRAIIRVIDKKSKEFKEVQDVNKE